MKDEKTTLPEIIKASDYGLEEKNVKDIELAFTPKIKEREGLFKIYEKLITNEVTKELCSEARELRLKLVKVRTGIAEIHTTQKAYFLASGKFVDAWKNKETKPVTQMEDKLIEIEKFYENIEKEKIETLQLERGLELEKYEEIIPGNLGELPQDIWDIYIKGKKANFEEKKAVEKKAEEKRIEEELINKLHNERNEIILPFLEFWEPELKGTHLGELTKSNFDNILKSLKQEKIDHDKKQEEIRKENDRLKKEAEIKAKLIKKQKSERTQKAIIFLVKQGFKKDEHGFKNDDHFIGTKHYDDFETDKEFESFKSDIIKSEEAKKERKLKEAQEKKQQQIYEANLEKERREKAKLKKEIEDKRIAEEEIKEAELNRVQDELNKGDEDKVKDLINDLTGLKTKYTFKSETNNKMYKDVGTLIDKVINHIKLNK